MSYTSICKNSKADNHHTWVCSLCYPFALEIGHLYGCGSLIFMKNHPLDTMAPKEYGDGKFALLAGQGHRDEETIIFDERPRVEITPEFKLYNYHPDYGTMKFDLSGAIELYEMAIEYGNYTKKQNFECFIIESLHKLINRWEKKNGNVEQFYENFVKERELWVIKRRSEQK